MRANALYKNNCSIDERMIEREPNNVKAESSSFDDAVQRRGANASGRNVRRIRAWSGTCGRRCTARLAQPNARQMEGADALAAGASTMSALGHGYRPAGPAPITTAFPPAPKACPSPAREHKKSQAVRLAFVLSTSGSLIPPECAASAPDRSGSGPTASACWPRKSAGTCWHRHRTSWRWPTACRPRPPYATATPAPAC